MNKQLQVLGHQDKKNGIDRLLRQADGDRVIQAAINRLSSAREIIGLEKVLAQTPLTISKLDFDHKGRLAIVTYHPNILDMYEFDGKILTDINMGLADKDKRNILGISFSPDGKYLAVGSSSSLSVHVFDGKRFNEIIKTKGNGALRLRDIAFSPDSEFIAAVDYNTIRFFRLYENDGEKLGELSTNIRQPGRISSVAFNPTKTHFASGSDEDNNLRIFNMEARLLEKQHTARVNDVAYSPCGDYIATAAGKTLRIFKLQNGSRGVKEIAKEKQPAWANAVAFSKDGKYIAAGGGFMDLGNPESTTKGFLNIYEIKRK